MSHSSTRSSIVFSCDAAELDAIVTIRSCKGRNAVVIQLVRREILQCSEKRSSWLGNEVTLELDANIYIYMLKMFKIIAECSAAEGVFIVVLVVVDCSTMI